jgi:hypothetical protein
MVFSNVFYPEYDFMGNLLQDLSNTSKTFDLMRILHLLLVGGKNYQKIIKMKYHRVSQI